MKTIAYQGIKGAFSYMTAERLFGSNNHFIGLPSFREVFELLDCGKADCAVVPIENSLIGSIYENYDFLHIYNVRINGEYYTKIELCLLADSVSRVQDEERVKTIKKIFSHPKALEQCTHFLRSHPWIEAVVHMDTAAAAAEIALKRDSSWAAIASASAAELYGLQIVKKSIEDDPRNYTRFVIVTKSEIEDVATDKCSLMFELEHTPGSLAEILNHFARIGVNLTKIESRPIHGAPFEYLFYVDLEFTVNQRQALVSLMDELGRKMKKLKILGFYKKGTLWIS